MFKKDNNNDLSFEQDRQLDLLLSEKKLDDDSRLNLSFKSDRQQDLSLLEDDIDIEYPETCNNNRK